MLWPAAGRLTFYLEEDLLGPRISLLGSQGALLCEGAGITELNDVTF